MGETRKETEKENREKEESESEKNEDIRRLRFEITVRIKQEEKMKYQ
jgi:hypothetical protein